MTKMYSSYLICHDLEQTSLR